MGVEDNYVAKNDRMMRYLRIQIEEVSHEYARATMPLFHDNENGEGFAHGGAIFTLADVAFGAAANDNKTCSLVSLSMTIEYLSPGKVSPLLAEARAVRLGGKIESYEVNVHDGAGSHVARVLCTGYQTRHPLPNI